MMRAKHVEVVMEYMVRTGPEGSVIAMSGDFTFADHETYRGVADAFRGLEGRSVTMDLSGLTFVDSAGLGMLLIARQLADKHNCKLVLKGARQQVRHMLSVAKFDSIMTIED